MSEEHRKFTGLPLAVVGPIDIGRLQRELEEIDNKLQDLAVRSPGEAVKLSKTSKLMDAVVELNKLNLLHEDDRQALKNFLDSIRAQAPILHISFSADPLPHFVEKLMVYLRKEIHPLALVTIGLQPNIGAGCIVRTTNKYFDFSLGKRLSEQNELLVSKIREEASA